jgi:lipopolysaccharide/colanic/teichoic acid biosynthesis glycosyltransferase
MGRRFLRIIFFSDLISLAIAMGFAAWVVFGGILPEAEQVPAGASIWPFVGLTFTGALIGSYLSRLAWTNAAPRPSYGRALAIVVVAAGFTALGLIITRAYWSRPLFLITTAAWLGLTLAVRAVLRQRPWAEHMLIVTAEKQLAEDIRETPHADVLAVLDPAEQPASDPLAEGATLVVDLRAVLSDEMAQYVSSNNLAGFRTRPLVDVYEEHTGRIPMVHLAEGWELARPVARSGYAPVKRVIDVFAVVITAPLWLLLGAIVWGIVKVDTPGKAIYAQPRVGRNGKIFTLYKFRTMVADAENDGPRFAEVGDSRITTTGRFLRKSRLDEIPQLWNVLRGDLTVVGPRPERPMFVERFEQVIPFYGSRTMVRPGVTGWAQVKYGYADDEADTVEKLTNDLYYIKHSSLWLDLQILGMSVWTVLSGFGAR